MHLYRNPKHQNSNKNSLEMSSQAYSNEKLKLQPPENFRFDSVPDSHNWPDLYDQPIVAGSLCQDSIPVIDLTDPKLTEKIGKACEEWGVFLISNHGIEPKLLNQLGSQIHRLFALPAEVKLKVAKTEGHMSGYGNISSSKFFDKFPWSEGFSIAGNPLDQAQILWPNDYSSFCEVIDEYKKVTKPLGCRLMNAMLLSLGLNEEELKHTLIGDSNKISNLVHLNSYPACPDPNRVLGLVPHTDTGFVTIVYHNGVSGLQVLKRKDGVGPARWVTVPVVPDTLVVNLGDLMHIVSNGKFHNVLHSATVDRTKHRLSAAVFFAPPLDEQVGPLSQLTGPKQGPLYKPMTWLDFLKLRDVLYDKTIQAIKICEN